MASEIRYQQSFVAYIDVLGFTEMVNHSDTARIGKYFDIAERSIGGLEAKIKGIKPGLGHIIISDCVILTLPLFDANQETENRNGNTGLLRQLCIAISIIQQELAINNIWTRGAVSCGETYFDQEKNQIVGPAYIDAYRLERDLAKNPRVILDTKIISKLGYDNASDLIRYVNDDTYDSSSDWNTRVLFEWTDSINRPIEGLMQDVPLFVDFIFSLFENKEDDKLTRLLLNIRKNMYARTDTYSKYRWLVDYIGVTRSQAVKAGFSPSSYNDTLIFEL